MSFPLEIKLNLKIFTRLSLLLFVSLTLIVFPARAQEDDPLGPQYIVQPGDTLSSIALRFDLSMNEIISASELANPDSLNVGDILVLPGIDWIDGVLVFEDIALGENFLSLQRRYLLSTDNLVRLNRITSPEQLFVGFPLLLATDRGELEEIARTVIAPGYSLLEAAVVSDDNPWAISIANQLAGTWQSVSGDVLFTPTQPGAGPGALPSPITSFAVQASGFVQGKAAVLSIETAENVSLSGQFFGQEIHFFADGDGQWTAIPGVPVNIEAGTYPLTISGDLNGAPFEIAQTVPVQPGGYSQETLTVDPSLLDPELSAAETSQIAQYISNATPEKMWTGFWGAPHPYTNVINSEFGTQRQYNGASFESYHYGVDFGGGVGVEIWAPAPGTVVFAGPLEVRGNATIIDHGWGIYTGYFHQSEILVNVGDTVSPGQLIGRVGNTGRSSGAHLHWEVWANGVSIQPLDWLSRVFP
jgi:murein DD-endopeptidase MepM/ murein hydrolase activator NlpD